LWGFWLVGFLKTNEASRRLLLQFGEVEQIRPVTAVILQPMKSPWYRHFFYRKQVLKTTWKLRLLIVLVFAAAIVVPHRFWATRIGQSLVCEENVAPSDALLLENFDISYRVFERAAALRKAGIASRVFVPTAIDGQSTPHEVSRQFADVMARNASLQEFETIPFHEKEPISLNAAKQVRDFLEKERIKSVVVIAPGLRSRRSAMVYNAVLVPAGIRVACSPIVGGRPIGAWTSTWHGFQGVIEQFIKLQYYRFYVLL
jgi:hypothetical protein